MMVDAQRDLAAALWLAAIVVLPPHAGKLRLRLRPSCQWDRHEQEKAQKKAQKKARGDALTAMKESLAVLHNRFMLSARNGKTRRRGPWLTASEFKAQRE